MEVGSDAGSIADLVTWLFENDSFAPAAKLTAKENYSVVCDHLGTPLTLYDEQGKPTWEMALDSYGAVRQGRGKAQDCPFRYQGQYEDTETGLYYNRFRYYDPEAGSYISQDPLGVGGGGAFYAYVHNPTSWLDVFGLASGPKDAVNALSNGATDVTVRNRAEAEQVLYQMQLKEGYTSSQGLNSTAAKDYYFGSKTKTPYYHWDDEWEWSQRLEEFTLKNHDALGPHARNPHIQFHPTKGDVQRVFWENFEKPKVCPS